MLQIGDFLDELIPSHALVRLQLLGDPRLNGRLFAPHRRLGSIRNTVNGNTVLCGELKFSVGLLSGAWLYGLSQARGWQRFVF